MLIRRSGEQILSYSAQMGRGQVPEPLINQLSTLANQPALRYAYSVSETVENPGPAARVKTVR